MNLDDQFFKNISTSESEVAAPPVWESFSSEVKRQNFKVAGFKHLNYFSLSVMILLFGGGIYAYFSTSAVSVKDDITPQQTIQQTEPVHTEQTLQAESAEETRVSDAVEVSSAIDAKAELKHEKKHADVIVEHEQLHEQPVTQAPMKEEQAQIEITHENTSQALLEPDNTVGTVEKADVLAGEAADDAAAEPRKSGKKSIVFAADTVFEYDTLTVKKKNRRR